jgi:pteridine reductase
VSLEGKTAFITGAARRLGRAMALHLAKAGCSVVAHYNRSSAEALSLRSETGCSILQADFRQLSVAGLRELLRREVPVADILINSASIFERGAWASVSEQQWDEEMAVNLKFPFFLCQFFGPSMRERGHGKIINILDIAAERPYLEYLPYSIARAGGVSLTRAFARALAPEVQVNAIAPGAIDVGEETEGDVIRRIPAGRAGHVDELLHALDYLLLGGDYVTGQVLVLDGGRTLTW